MTTMKPLLHPKLGGEIAVSNDVNAMDELNEDDTGSDDVLQSDAKSAAAGEKEILSVEDSGSDVLGAKGSKITIADAYSEKIDSSHYIIRVAGFVTGVDYEEIDKGTVSIYLNDESKGTCTAYSGMFDGAVVDVGPGKYNVRVRYHDDSGDYDDSQNEYYDNPIIIEPPEPTTWYVNGSKSYGGGGKSEADAFSTLNEALVAASNNDIVKIAAGTYAGDSNIGGYIQKILTFEKYGDGEAIFDGQGQGTIWSVGVNTINIYGLTFINGGGNHGGAIYFLYDASDSVINATFINNSVSIYGGAIYVDNSVSNLTLRSTFINNTANEYGAAVYIKSTASNLILNSTFIGNTAGNNGAAVYIGGNADNVKVYGEYRNNAASQGGVIYANKAFSSSVIDATFINNTAKKLGGAFCFNGDLTGVDISGKFINNTGGDSIIYIGNSVSYNSIHDSVFLNNEAYKIFSVNDGEITAKDNWFGNNASNYYEMPEDVGIDLESWLFLNATADPSELEADEKSAIIFKLSSFGGSEISDYDASKMNIALDLSQTLGQLDKTSASIGENITYTAKESGNATVTGKFETASYTVRLTNSDPRTPTSINVTNSTLDLKVKDDVAAGATLTPADAGNLTYTSSNSSVAVVENGRIKALAAGSAIITVSFAGNETYAPSSKTIAVIVSWYDASISVNNATLDLLVGDDFSIVTTTVPGGLNVTFTPDNSGVVSVDENSVVTALKEGKATVKVSVGGDGFYALNTTDVTVTVKKISTEIIVNNDTLNMYVGDVAGGVASLNPPAAGNLTYISFNNDVVKVEGDKLVAVANGTTTVIVNFAGNNKYEAANSKVISVVVKLKDASVSVNNATLDLFVGDDFSIVTTTVPGGLSVTFTPDNSGVVSVDENGVVTALKEGKTTVKVSVGGDGFYALNTTDVTVNVKKIPTEIIANATLNMSVGDVASNVASLKPSAAGNLTYVSGNSSVVRVEDGKLVAVANGTAIVLVNFAGNNKYEAAISKVINVTVKLKDASVSVNNAALDLLVNDTFKLIATTVPEGLNVYYSFTNESVAIVDSNGTVTAVGIGKATIVVTVGDGKVYAVNSTNVTVTVKQATSITAADVSATYKVNKDLVITLKDANGKPIANAKVTVDLKGAKTYTTDKNGQVKVATKGLAPKAYTAKVTFNGNDNYTKSTKNVKVTVKKATPKLTAKKKTFKSSTKTKKYSIVLKDNTGKAIKKAKVTLKVKGKTYKATTNSKGKATFKIKKLNKKGTFKATVTYKGNKYFKKVSKKAKIKVTVTFKTVSKGSKDKATVMKIQTALKNKGYYTTYKGHYLKVDGKFSKNTVRSIKQFQKDKGLKVTGKVDEKTAKKLGIIF